MLNLILSVTSGLIFFHTDALNTKHYLIAMTNVHNNVLELGSDYYSNFPPQTSNKSLLTRYSSNMVRK